jgi:hypothetical protein
VCGSGSGFSRSRDRRSLQRDETLGLATSMAEPGQVGLHLAVLPERLQCRAENGEGAGIVGADDAVVHPFSFAARAHNAGVAQIGEMPGDLGLALLENFNEITDADFAAIHEIEEAQARGFRERGEEAREAERFGGAGHGPIIYGLTDV